MGKPELEKLIKERRQWRSRQLEALSSYLESLSATESAKWQQITSLKFDDLKDALQTGTYSAVDVLHAYQWNALKANDVTNCITTLIEEAESWAQRLDQEYGDNKQKPPLFGMPFSIKEQIEVTGVETTYGYVHLLTAAKADRDAVCVEMLKRAGALPFVRTNIPQGMVSINCSNPIYGLTVHPLKATRTPGGSSGGEGALLSMNGAVFGLGTDGGGSIRVPSHFCGIAGLKPTMTRVSQVGVGSNLPGTVVLGLTWGPMAPQVETLACVLDASLQPDAVAEIDPYVSMQPFNRSIYESHKPLRIGYYDYDGFTEALTPMRRAVAEVKEKLEKRGHTLVSYQPVDIQLGLSLFFSLFLPDGGTELLRWLNRDIYDEYNSGFFNLLKIPTFIKRFLAFILSPFLPRVALLLRSPRSTADELRDAYGKTMRYRQDTVKEWKKMGVDAVICPAAGHPAPTHRLPDKVGFLVSGAFIVFHIKLSNLSTSLGASYTALYNLLDFAAGSVPVSRVTRQDLEGIKQSSCEDPFAKMIKNDFLDEEIIGLPVGVQVVTLPNQEELCLRVMKEIEAEFPQN